MQRSGANLVWIMLSNALALSPSSNQTKETAHRFPTFEDSVQGDETRGVHRTGAAVPNSCLCDLFLRTSITLFNLKAVVYFYLLAICFCPRFPKRSYMCLSLSSS